MNAWQRFRVELHWRTRHLGARRWEVFWGGHPLGRFRNWEAAAALTTEIGDTIRDHKYHYPRSACWKWS